jgi:SSS family solute:Na+ symporter
MIEIDLIIIAAYLIIVIGVGIFVGKKKKIESKEDYLLAGRSLPLPIYVAGLSAVVIGGGITTGSAQYAYSLGITGIWLSLLTAISIFLLGFLVTTKLSKMRIFTTNEAVGIFYGKNSRIMSTIVTTIYLFFVGVIQVVAIGTAMSTIINANFMVSMITGAVVILIYLFIGGMWSVAITDICQFTVMTLGIIVIGPIFGLMELGGFSGLAANLPDSYFNIMAMGNERVLGYIMAIIPGYLIGQDIWQRTFSAKNSKVAKTGAIISSFYIILYGAGAVLVGLCLAATGARLENPSSAFATSIMNAVPVGLRGVVLAALIAAILSSANGAILGASSVIYSDIFEAFGKKEVSEKQKVLSLRILSAVIVVFVTIVSLWLKSIVGAIDIAYAYLSGCVFVPLMFALLFKRVSAKAGLFSMSAGFIATTVLMIRSGSTSIAVTIYGMAACAIVFFVTHLFDNNKIETTIEYPEKNKLNIPGDHPLHR